MVKFSFLFVSSLFIIIILNVISECNVKFKFCQIDGILGIMTIEIKEIDNLANLARVAISDNEKENLRHDLEEILAYVSQVKEAGEKVKSNKEQRDLRNIMRDDRDPHTPGLFTETLLSSAPAREDDRVLVKKIL